MEVLEINKLTATEGPTAEFINKSLESGSYCEYMYHSYIFEVCVSYESNMDILLRAFYESYCNSLGKDLSTYIKCYEPGKLTFWMTLMDAIDYIYQATPPLLQSEIKSSITSIDNIIEILKTYVLEDNADKQYRVGLFLKVNGFYEREMTWTIPEKMNLIQTIVGDNKPVAYVDIDTEYINQYIVACPLSKLNTITDIINDIRITNVVVLSTSITKPKIVYIKGCRQFSFKVKEPHAVDRLCDETFIECEKILNNK